MAHRRGERTGEEIGLGVSTLYLLGQGFDSVPRAIRRNKVDHWELFDDGNHKLNPSRVASLKRLSRQRGISYSVHGPICDLNLATLNYDVSNLVMKRLENSMGHASSLEATIWILHPGTHGALSWVTPGEDLKANLSRIRLLKQLGDRFNVGILLENISANLAILGRASDFHQLYREWRNAPGMTLDIGHASIRGETRKYLPSLANHVKHVHAHDNDGTIDKHMQVGAGRVDWKWTIRALTDSEFQGKIVVESVKGPFASLTSLQKLLKSI